MISLDITKKKYLNFQVNVSGINSQDLSGSIRLEIDGIEYGFPVLIESDTINVTIPPLKSVINKSIKEGDEIKARLDIVGNGHYLNPWNDIIVVKSGVIAVEATLIDNNNVKPIVQLKEENNTRKVIDKKNIIIIKEQNQPKRKVVQIEQKEKKKNNNIAITEDIIYEYMKYKGIKNPRIQEVIYSRALQESKTDDKKEVLQSVIKFLRKNKTNK